MTKPVESLIESFCDALQPGARYDHFIAEAEKEGYPQVAKMFRAVVVSEEVRERLLRRFMPNKVAKTCDFFVCPYCGLVFEPEPPEKCPVDDTPGDQFTAVR